MGGLVFYIQSGRGSSRAPLQSCSHFGCLQGLLGRVGQLRAHCSEEISQASPAGRDPRRVRFTSCPQTVADNATAPQPSHRGNRHDVLSYPFCQSDFDRRSRIGPHAQGILDPLVQRRQPVCGLADSVATAAELFFLRKAQGKFRRWRTITNTRKTVRKTVTPLPHERTVDLLNAHDCSSCEPSSNCRES